MAKTYLNLKQIKKSSSPGSIIITDGTNTPSYIAPGSEGQGLVSDGSGGLSYENAIVIDVSSTDYLTYDPVLRKLSISVPSINEDLIDYVSIVSNISTTYDIDWNSASHWDLTMTANTTITESNIPIAGKVKTITIELKGNFSPTLPVAWGVLGTYDGVNGSQLVIQSWNNGSYYAIFNDLV